MSKVITECINCFDLQVEATNFFLQTLLNSQVKNFSSALLAILSAYIELDPDRGLLITGMVIREIGKLEESDFAIDSSASKSIASFLESLAELCPSVVLGNISVLLPHLEMDNYTMRNGIVQMFGKLLLFLHKRVVEEKKPQKFPEGVDEVNSRKLKPKSNSGRTRDSLLELLLERVNDVNSFTRSKVLQTWKELAEAKAIPVKLYSMVAAIAIERLDDKISQVRKFSLQLLTSLLQNNPFGPTLRMTDFSDRLKNSDELDKEHLYYFQQAVHFLEKFNDSIEKIMAQLAYGPTMVMECINLIKVANEFRVQNSEKGLRRLLPLVVSMAKEQGVYDAVVCAYADIFLPENAKPKNSALSLVRLALSVSFSERKCLAKIVGELVKKNVITKQVVEAIWELFLAYELGRCSEKRGTLDIISMIGAVYPKIIQEKLCAILKEVFSNVQEKIDASLIRTTWILVLCLEEIPDSVSGENLHDLVFSQIEGFLLSNNVSLDWFGAAEQALNVLFKFHPEPSGFAAKILLNCACKYGLTDQDKTSCSSWDLAQLCFLTGHIALKLLMQIEIVITFIY